MTASASGGDVLPAIPAIGPEALSRIFTSIPVAVHVMEADADLRIVYANPAFEQAAPSLPAAGRRLSEIFPDIAASGAARALLRVAETGRPMVWRIRSGGAGAGSPYAATTAHPLRDSAGRVTHILATGLTARDQAAEGTWGQGRLETENEETDDPGEARAWADIYRQLVALHRRMLTRTRAALRAQRVHTGADIALLEDHLHLFEARLKFWDQRRWQVEGVHYDPERLALTHRGREVTLTGRESQLLELLMAHPGRWFKAADLVSRAWHDPHLSPEQARMYVGRLRTKLAGLDVPWTLANEPGRGYSLVTG